MQLIPEHLGPKKGISTLQWGMGQRHTAVSPVTDGLTGNPFHE
jgi:hypothetical protein